MFFIQYNHAAFCLSADEGLAENLRLGSQLSGSWEHLHSVTCSICTVRWVPPGEVINSRQFMLKVLNRVCRLVFLSMPIPAPQHMYHIL